MNQLKPFAEHREELSKQKIPKSYESSFRKALELADADLLLPVRERVQWNHKKRRRQSKSKSSEGSGSSSNQKKQKKQQKDEEEGDEEEVDEPEEEGEEVHEDEGEAYEVCNLVDMVPQT